MIYPLKRGNMVTWILKIRILPMILDKIDLNPEGYKTVNESSDFYVLRSVLRL